MFFLMRKNHSAKFIRFELWPTTLGGSMGLKCETKPNQNNTPVYCAHLDKYNGIVLAYLPYTCTSKTGLRNLNMWRELWAKL